MKVPAIFKPAIFAGLRAVPLLERRLLPSAGYRLVDDTEVEGLRSASGWKLPGAAKRQQRAYDRLLADVARGRPRRDFEIAARAVDATGYTQPSLLEVGCGGGYHSAVFANLCASAPRYVGSDYSEAMVAGARRRFPGVTFEVADATALPYGDDSFDIVFEGVALMHIPDHAAAVGEIARVARGYVVFHCTPVFDDHPTSHLFKYAYGEPVTEKVFARDELESLFDRSGLQVVESWNALPYDLVRVTGAHSHARTFLCRKRANS